jgi:hypothetical protein
LKIAAPLAYRCHLARSCGSAMCTIGSKAALFSAHRIIKPNPRLQILRFG